LNDADENISKEVAHSNFKSNSLKSLSQNSTN